jgi:CubicO group peptidase (beta-lactamase class C family)
MVRRALRGLVVLAVLAAPQAGKAVAQSVAQAPGPAAALPIPAAIDKIFSAWDRPGSPGCAVGVAMRGHLLHLQGYGMANLEYGVRIRPGTIFETGSVAKQFTAAAIALLAQDGKLSIDDPVRKYVPELPDFGTAILIRHLLNHTSGLRSQWPMLTLAGRPPGLAVHSVDEILELVSHYRELNFAPGDEYLYNNTGFTLLSVVVARVSGKGFNEFCQERLFRPLGMQRTQWREDFTAVVEDRATAYRRLPDGEFRTNMPFTNVIGNGGLLTTVGDLLLWNDNLDRPRVGGRALVDQLQRVGRLNDGSETGYAQGLFVADYRGVREVSHGGSTAGYHTFLGRFPDEGLSVAVLCNAANTDPAGYAHQVADLVLAARLKERPIAQAIEVREGVLERMAGVYLNTSTDALLHLVWDKQAKALKAGDQVLIPTGDGELLAADGSRTYSTGMGWPGGLVPGRLTEKAGRSKPRVWEIQRPFKPAPAELETFSGDFVSEELGVTYTAFVEGGALRIRFRPAYRLTLVPVFKDGFECDGTTLRFTRGPAGQVDGILVSTDRARRVRFVKREPRSQDNRTRR